MDQELQIVEVARSMLGENRTTAWMAGVRKKHHRALLHLNIASILGIGSRAAPSIVHIF